ncbi:MAG: hypothetical protein JW785_12375 [Acidimicrobiia bacterium]|nr:hypothetical protein [Acidimicrobiia bacterium]
MTARIPTSTAIPHHTPASPHPSGSTTASIPAAAAAAAPVAPAQEPADQGLGGDRQGIERQGEEEPHLKDHLVNGRAGIPGPYRARHPRRRPVLQEGKGVEHHGEGGHRHSQGTQGGRPQASDESGVDQGQQRIGGQGTQGRERQGGDLPVVRAPPKQTGQRPHDPRPG